MARDDRADEDDRRREPAAQEDVRRVEHAERVVEGSPWKKVTRPSQRRAMAGKAVAKHEVSIALACRTFGVSETCYRYSPLLSDENEGIADLLLGLTDAKKTWGFGLCFLHLRNLQGRASAAIGSRQWRGSGTTKGSIASTVSWR